MANDILGTRSPNGAVGVRGVADSGELSIFNAGALSGFGLVVSGFNIIAGGQVGKQDVAVAKNSAGESDLLVGNGAAMTFTLPGAPATSGQSQVHALVLWKDSTVVSTVNDGLDAVGYQIVSGAAATTGQQPTPSDADIRAAIPQGSTAFVCLLAYVTVNYGDPAVVASRIVPFRSAIKTENGGMGSEKPITSVSPANVTMYAGYNLVSCRLAKIGNIATVVIRFTANAAWNGTSDTDFGKIHANLAPASLLTFGLQGAASGDAAVVASIGTSGVLSLAQATTAVPAGGTYILAATYLTSSAESPL